MPNNENHENNEPTNENEEGADQLSEHASVELEVTSEPTSSEATPTVPSKSGGAHFKVPEKRSYKKLKVALISVAAVLVVAYVGFSILFNFRFGFNTTINGINCSLLTPEEAEEKIHESIVNYGLEIHARGAEIKTINGTVVELTYVPNGELQALHASQPSFLWPARLFNPSETGDLDLNITLNEDKLNAIISGFEFMNPANMRAPADAYVEYVPPSYQVHAEDLGTTIDDQVARSAIRESLLAMETALHFDAAGCYIKPVVYSDAPELQDKIQLFTEKVPFSITYTLGDTTVVLDGNIAINWALPEGGIDSRAVATWVDEFADRYDTYNKERTFIASNGEERTVSGGTYGWQINRAAEVEAILATIAAKTAEVREPLFSRSAASLSGPDWGNTFVEIDLSMQHMWYYENGELLLESDVVTGRPNGHATPQGVYYLLAMQSPAVLRGRIMPATGEPEYVSPVSYWMPFTSQGHGLHDANWQSRFGGTRYRTNGSHGCVNMPYSNAKELYSLIEVGCPVVLHY